MVLVVDVRQVYVYYSSKYFWIRAHVASTTQLLWNYRQIIVKLLWNYCQIIVKFCEIIVKLWDIVVDKHTRA